VGGRKKRRKEESTKKFSIHRTLAKPIYIIVDKNGSPRTESTATNLE
jgi:hypothetical protein